MMVSILVLALIGFAVALYDYSVEKKIEREPTYKPMCDISDRISCSKPLKSPYAKLIFFSNAILGMFYYALIAFLTLLGLNKLLLMTALCGAIASCYLAYILFVKVRSVCLVCVTLYVINFLILCAAFGIK